MLLDEDLNFVIGVHSDEEGAGSYPLNITLSSPDQRMEVVFDYTITLSSRGLPYTGPRPGYCTPISFIANASSPTARRAPSPRSC